MPMPVPLRTAHLRPSNASARNRFDCAPQPHFQIEPPSAPQLLRSLPPSVFPLHSRQKQLHGEKTLGLSQAVRNRPRCQLGLPASRSPLLACPHSMLFAPPFRLHCSLERRAHRDFCVSNQNRGFSPLPTPR